MTPNCFPGTRHVAWSILALTVLVSGISDPARAQTSEPSQGAGGGMDCAMHGGAAKNPDPSTGGPQHHAADSEHSGHSDHSGHSADLAGADAHSDHSSHSEDDPIGDETAFLPTESGQSAFAALSEIAGQLWADPNTDWTTVNLDRLRDHLIDMNRVMLWARVERTNLPDGFEARVTGDAETVGSIHRMLGAHGRMMQGRYGWKVDIEERQDGALLRVTSPQADEADRLRGLGFSGFLTADNHHGPHHFQLAKGNQPHRH